MSPSYLSLAHLLSFTAQAGMLGTEHKMGKPGARMSSDVHTEHKKEEKAKQPGKGHGKWLEDWKNPGRLPGGGEVGKVLEGKWR